MGRRQGLIVVGAGGFGQEIIWAAKNFNRIYPTFDVLGYCDDAPDKKGKDIYGYQVLGAPEEVDRALPEKPCFLCAIGKNRVRSHVVRRVLALGWRPVSIIDPSVTVAECVTVGDGTYVSNYAILSPYARLGDHVIVNCHATIGHNSVLEDFVQVSPGVRVSGGTILKEGAMVGSNAALAPGVTLGRYSILGACSFAASDIPDGVTAVGVPAQVMMRHSA